MGGFIIVGLLGIEPSLYAPEAHVLPVYYSPSGGESDKFTCTISLERWAASFAPQPVFPIRN
jgi:hypothetical protein